MTNLGPCLRMYAGTTVLHLVRDDACVLVGRTEVIITGSGVTTQPFKT